MNDVSILFCTCDSYSDLWEGFFTLLEKYWPESKSMPILFNSERASYNNDKFNIRVIEHGVNLSWSNRLNDALKQADTKYIILFLDDYYLRGRVQNNKFIETVEFLKSNSQVGSICYLKEPGISKIVEELPFFSYRKQFSLYKIAARVTIYDKYFLMTMLRNNESAWEFEVNGTFRSWFKSKKHICATNNNSPIFPYDFSGWSLCMKGQFFKPVKEYFEKNEGIVFPSGRDTIDEIKIANNNSLLHNVSKIKYPIAGLISLFAKKPN